MVGTGMVAVAGALGTKAGEALAAEFGKLVIERWSRARAEKFFTAFLEEISEELQQGVELPTTVGRLQGILRDDAASEVLFEAYRRVCFARSRDIGPRIIGLLVGQVLVEGRTATWIEEEVFAAAEGMTDDDLMQATEFAESPHCHTAESANWVAGVPSTALEIQWCERTRDGNSDTNEPLEIGPLQLDDCLGGWALRAQALGMVGQSTIETNKRYFADGRYADEDGTIRRIKSLIRVSPSLFRLGQLVRRAVGVSPSA